MEHLFPYPKMGHSFLEVLHDSLTRKVVGYDDLDSTTPHNFIANVHTRLADITQNPVKHLYIAKIGYSALEAFLQSNCTGPPLEFETQEIVIPPSLASHAQSLKAAFLKALEVDGAAVYPLTPNIELFWLARVCMSNETIAEAGFNGRRARWRALFIHQKLLLERSETLKELLYTDAEILDSQLSSRLAFHGAAAEEHYVEFLMERAAVRTYYGDEDLAREDLLHAAKLRRFQFALTGALGKRTKFQDRDLSQLVVLARSRDNEPEPYSSRKSSRVDGMDSRKSSQAEQGRGSPLSFSSSQPSAESPAMPPSQLQKPTNLPLNDDTLLEAIQFKQMPDTTEHLNTISETSELPPRLASLDPANQPLLHPMDSIILLAIASTISSTSPSDSLTREETLPYATRVLEGGSSNWQVYTQALLVRSRIEGYKSRTAERGLLQLQALVDQVVAETSATQQGSAAEEHHQPTTFLPKPTPDQSASVAERLRFIYQLSPPLRWELESELASRWVSMGGLKTALEIYERLQMHAEAALCLAATDQEADAVQKIRRLLFDQDDATEKKDLPAEAARLYCILGDIRQDPACYERAWAVSNNRYARAQRSLGRHFTQKKQYPEAVEAYQKALRINRLNASTWFALGCVQLELQDWEGAVDSFTRCVREKEDDAEAWSNLAVALLRLPEPEPRSEAEQDTTNDGVQSLDLLDQLAAQGDEEQRTPTDDADDDVVANEEELETTSITPLASTSSPPAPTHHRNTFAALSSLKRAAQLKHSDPRIWDNYLTAASSIPPPHTPWRDILQSQSRILSLRGDESSIDTSILSALVHQVTTTTTYPSEPTSSTMRIGSIPRLLTEMIDTQIIPLITTNPRLWRIVSVVQRWRHRPLAALDAEEKSWRIVTTNSNSYSSTEKEWNDIVVATMDLVTAYEELGEMDREEGSGLVVEKNWRFKARSAVRGVMGKGRPSWEGSPGWEKLVACLEEVKNK